MALNARDVSCTSTIQSCSSQHVCIEQSYAQQSGVVLVGNKELEGWTSTVEKDYGKDAVKKDACEMASSVAPPKKKVYDSAEGS